MLATSWLFDDEIINKAEALLLDIDRLAIVVRDQSIGKRPRSTCRRIIGLIGRAIRVIAAAPVLVPGIGSRVYSEVLFDGGAIVQGDS
ncbi:hypothetical protein D3C71_2085060 [compost metagenome]